MSKKRNFENIFLTIIFLIIVYYISIFVLSFFKNTDLKLPSFDTNISFNLPKIPEIKNINEYIDFEIPDINISILNIDTNYFLNKFKSNNSDKNISKNNQNILNTLSYDDMYKDINYSNPKMTMLKITQYTKIVYPKVKKEVKKIKPIEKTLKEKKKLVNNNSAKNKKEIMLNELRKYIKKTIISVRNNASTNKRLNELNNFIRIRVTVLKNGKYKNVKYLKGNNQLLNDAKNALSITFPKVPKEIIKSQFPRYLRFKIEFRNY